jgi:hypothetical protein
VYGFTGVLTMHTQTDQRYQFAMSAFVRMYGHSIVNNIDIKQFCKEWSTWEVNPPLQGLDEVDQYLYYEYKNWRGR